jgi:heterogeneous nuclear ribonucleoprotein F/H
MEQQQHQDTAARGPPSTLQQSQQDEALPAATIVLRLRGLPFTATEADVHEFFAGHPIDDSPGSVVVVTQGYHRGEGYVRFASAEVCAAAHFDMNRKNIGGRYIELYASTEGALELQRSSQEQMSQEKRFFIRLRGLPWSAAESDIRDFLSPVGANNVLSVHMTYGPDGRFTGNVFTELATEEAAALARDQLHRASMGTRYIEVFESSLLERDAALTAERRRRRQDRANGQALRFQPASAFSGQQHHQHYHQHHHQQTSLEMQYPPPLPHYTQQQQQPQPPSVFGIAPSHTHPPPRQPYPVIRIRGLPFTANESTVAEFLSGVNIPPHSVHMVFNVDERPTGEAFVEVCTEADVNAALALNRRTIGRRYIELFRSSQGEMHRLQMGEAPVPEGYFGNPPVTSQHHQSQHQHPPPPLPMRSMPSPFAPFSGLQPPPPPFGVGSSGPVPVHPHQVHPPYQMPMMPGQPFRGHHLPVMPPHFSAPPPAAVNAGQQPRW